MNTQHTPTPSCSGSPQTGTHITWLGTRRAGRGDGLHRARPCDREAQATGNGDRDCGRRPVYHRAGLAQRLPHRGKAGRRSIPRSWRGLLPRQTLVVHREEPNCCRHGRRTINPRPDERSRPSAADVHSLAAHPASLACRYRDRRWPPHHASGGRACHHRVPRTTTRSTSPQPCRRRPKHCRAGHHRGIPGIHRSPRTAADRRRARPSRGAPGRQMGLGRGCARAYEPCIDSRDLRF